MVQTFENRPILLKILQNAHTVIDLFMPATAQLEIV